MFKVFKRRRDKPSLMYGLFQKVGAWCEVKQRLLCDKLSQKVQRFNVKQLKIGLMLFCVGYVTCLGLVLVQAFRDFNPVIKVQSIRLPVQVTDSIYVMEKVMNP